MFSGISVVLCGLPWQTVFFLSFFSGVGKYNVYMRAADESKPGQHL